MQAKKNFFYNEVRLGTNSKAIRLTEPPIKLYVYPLNDKRMLDNALVSILS